MALLSYDLILLLKSNMEFNPTWSSIQHGVQSNMEFKHTSRRTFYVDGQWEEAFVCCCEVVGAPCRPKGITRN